MYKARLSAWEVGKNVSKKDRLWVVLLLRQRREAGKPTSIVYTRDRLRTVKDCLKYLKECETPELDILAAAAASGKEIVPPYIRCVTPEGSTSEALDHAVDLPQAPSNDSETKVEFPHPISSSHSSKNGRHHGKPSSFVNVESHKATMQLPSQPNGAAATYHIDLSSESFETLSSSQDAPSVPQGEACDRLQHDVRTMVEQIASPQKVQSFAANLGDLPSWSLLSRCPGSGFLEEKCSKCGHEISKHAPIPQGFLSTKATELPHEYQSLLSADEDYYSAFTAACMSACMYGVKGDYDIMSLCMQSASSVYEQMLRRDDPLALVGVNMALTWLHAHEQGPMAGSVIRSALRVADAVLGPASAITITLEWMTAVAFRKQKDCPIKTPMLKNVYRRLKESHGATHQHTIVAIYNLGYNLIQDREYKEAEDCLRYLVDISSHNPSLGPASLQTVSALNTLSRAQAWQGNYEMALETLQKGLRHTPLGPNHPFRLASIKRHAYLLKKLGRIPEEEPLRWTVLEGRIATLGPQHVNTQKAREELIDLLKELGRWEVMEREVEKLFETMKTRTPHMAEDEDRWRRVVVEGSSC
jgi:tetratricopeptide (TPR) repeat protein